MSEITEALDTLVANTTALLATVTEVSETFEESKDTAVASASTASEQAAIATEAADEATDTVATATAALTAAVEADRILAQSAATSSVANALAAAASAASISDYSARVQAILKTRGLTDIKSIVFKKAEGWERTVQASYVTETRPTGRFLGDYANATAAWAAAVDGIATVSGDYYWNTTSSSQHKCTTSNASTEIYRGAQTTCHWKP